MAKLLLKATNNEVECEALIVGLSFARALGATEVEIKTDSQVVINQIVEAYAARGEKLKKYLNQIWESRD